MPKKSAPKTKSKTKCVASYKNDSEKKTNQDRQKLLRVLITIYFFAKNKSTDTQELQEVHKQLWEIGQRKFEKILRQFGIFGAEFAGEFFKEPWSQKKENETPISELAKPFAESIGDLSAPKKIIGYISNSKNTEKCYKDLVKYLKELRTDHERLVDSEKKRGRKGKQGSSVRSNKNRDRDSHSKNGNKRRRV